MKKISTRLGLPVLLVGIVSVGFTTRRTQMVMRTPYTMHSTQTSYNIGAPGSYLNATKVKYQKANGDWKEITTYFNRDGSVKAVNTCIAITNVGVFEVNDNLRELIFISPKAHAMHLETEDQLRADPKFVREDKVLGYKTIVEHESQIGKPDFVETHRAPALGGAIIKIVDSGATPDQYTVIEATRIDVGEPTESFNYPAYPFSYSFYQSQIEKEELLGHKQAAASMRQLVAKHQAAYK